MKTRTIVLSVLAVALVGAGAYYYRARSAKAQQEAEEKAKADAAARQKAKENAPDALLKKGLGTLAGGVGNFLASDGFQNAVAAVGSVAASKAKDESFD